MSSISDLEPYFSTKFGNAYLGDSLKILPKIEEKSIDLICTSPPFALERQKAYGNVTESEYVKWFMNFAKEFKRILTPKGSLIIDIGGSWIKGRPIRSLYNFQLLIEMCKPESEGGLGFNLAQELYWYNPAKLPTPAEWVTVRRIRVKDAVNTVWWLCLDDNPKASNKRVLKPYSESQKKLMINGYKAKTRPSEHVISKKFGKDNNGAIPPNIINAMENKDDVMGDCVPVNLISFSNTSSNDPYLRACILKGIKPHPARFPRALPEFAISMCTEKNDIVLDPFAGSNMAGYIAEKLGRRWIAIESEEDYLKGAKLRFEYELEDIRKAEAFAKLNGNQPA
jgi:DNA modification methylase